jgi:hypothetical protein
MVELFSNRSGIYESSPLAVEKNLEKSQIIQELYLQNCGSRDIS